MERPRDCLGGSGDFVCALAVAGVLRSLRVAGVVTRSGVRSCGGRELDRGRFGVVSSSSILCWLVALSGVFGDSCSFRGT